MLSVAATLRRFLSVLLALPFCYSRNSAFGSSNGKACITWATIVSGSSCFGTSYQQEWPKPEPSKSPRRNGRTFSVTELDGKQTSSGPCVVG
ncbi:uncharacterized protein K452DRAFT_136125 [Aplosporella prunicola CBS 121167]|uniref:Secreted protein n=1 Tax=Aplosporella prunicola CBS 121167 TaxID=1176127 RepID=A0A6A6BP26_9PEZI|nr:uncharacterized protein K452DRAFT_136125 [Aplosporella prunicola CBS 121167]KAF2145193.1 hypothetical protein K452DRAFT_136125 [Aplosporella prunicola CBS 121167]